MKYLFTTALIVGLASCGTNKTECCDTHTEDQVDCHPTDSTGRFDFSQEKGVSDSLVYGEIEPNIDSLENVGELLDYLETIPPTRR